MMFWITNNNGPTMTQHSVNGIGDIDKWIDNLNEKVRKIRPCCSTPQELIIRSRINDIQISDVESFVRIYWKEECRRNGKWVKK